MILRNVLSQFFIVKCFSKSLLVRKIRDSSAKRKYLITASNLTELTLTLNNIKVVRTYF